MQDRNHYTTTLGLDKLCKIVQFWTAGIVILSKTDWKAKYKTEIKSKLSGILLSHWMVNKN